MTTYFELYLLIGVGLCLGRFPVSVARVKGHPFIALVLAHSTVVIFYVVLWPLAFLSILNNAATKVD